MFGRRSLLAGLAAIGMVTSARSQSSPAPAPPPPPTPLPTPPPPMPFPTTGQPSGGTFLHSGVRSLLTEPARLPTDPSILPIPSYWGPPAQRTRAGWVRDRVDQLTRDFASGQEFGSGLRSEQLLQNPREFASEVAAVCQALFDMPRMQVTQLTRIRFREGPWAYSVPAWFYPPTVPIETVVARLPDMIRNDWIVASAVRLLKLRIGAWMLEDLARSIPNIVRHPDRAGTLQFGRELSRVARDEFGQIAEFFKVADEEYACLLAATLRLDGPRMGQFLTQQDRSRVTATFASLPLNGRQAVQPSIRPLLEEARLSIVSARCDLCHQMDY